MGDIISALGLDVNECEVVDRNAFMKTLSERFPVVHSAIDEIDDGLLHCEVAVLRRSAEKAMDEGHLWKAEQFFRFIEEILPGADEALENAVEISFIEDVAKHSAKPGRLV